MATSITNQASLTYAYGDQSGSALSNVATAVIEDTLAITKAAVADNYTPGDSVAYTISLVNNGASALNGLTVTDNLGTYTLTGSGSATPLTYTGPAKLYVNGAYISDLTPARTANSVTFTVPTLAAGANALIVYNAIPNAFASGATGSTITNTASATAAGIPAPVTASASLGVDNYASVTMLKAITPETLTDGGAVTYTFTLYNYGNTAATNVVLSDAFNPAPTITGITVNGTAVPSSDYTYSGGVLTLPATGSAYSLTVPAATFTQNASTGAVTSTPGVTTVVVTGTI